MAQTKSNKPVVFQVSRTKLNDKFVGSGISPLGRKLMKIANEIENSDTQPLSEADIEMELEKRRGGYLRNGR